MADKDNPGKKEAYKVEVDTSPMAKAIFEALQDPQNNSGLFIGVDYEKSASHKEGRPSVEKQPDRSKTGADNLRDSVSAEVQIKKLMDEIELSQDNIADIVDMLKEILVGYKNNERNKIIARHVDLKYTGKRISHPKLGELLADKGDSLGDEAMKSRGQRARGRK